MKKQSLFTKLCISLFLIFLTASVLLSSVIYGQEPRISGGLKIGGNLNLPNWDPSIPIGNLKSGLSFNFGGVVDIDISKNFGIEVDLLHNNFKTNWDYSETVLGVPVDFEATYSLTTISLPILAKVKFPSKQITPFLGLGPELGFTLSHKLKLKATALGETVRTTTNLTDSTETLNFGIVLCFGVDINLNETILTPELRFNLGLVDLDTSWASAKNSQIALFFSVKDLSLFKRKTSEIETSPTKPKETEALKESEKLEKALKELKE